MSRSYPIDLTNVQEKLIQPYYHPIPQAKPGGRPDLLHYVALCPALHPDGRP